MQRAPPAMAFDIVLGKAGVGSPGLVAKIHESIGPVARSQHRDCINGQLQFLFGPAGPFLRLLAFGIFGAQRLIERLQFPHRSLLLVADQPKRGRRPSLRGAQRDDKERRDDKECEPRNFLQFRSE